MRITIFLILIVLVKVGYSQKQFNPFDHSLLGQTAPNFVAKTLDNKEIKLQDLKGKVVLLDFWSLSCAACFKELPELNEIVEKYSDDDFTLISVMDNSREQLLEKFEIAKNGYILKKPVFGNDKINFQVIPNGEEIMRLYNEQLMYPHAFIIDRKGTIQFYMKGYAEKLGIPDEITSKQTLTEELDKLLNASR